MSSNLNDSHRIRSGITILLALVSFIIIPNMSLAGERGGTRKDYQFSSWKQLERELLSEVRSVKKQKEEVRRLRQKYKAAEEKYHTTEKGGFLGLFDPKKKARKEMDATHSAFNSAERRVESTEEKIKDYLTSTPPGNRLRNLSRFKANTEATELRNALVTVQATVESLGMMLKTEKSNALTAIEYYDFYLELLGYLQAMHANFVERAEGEYYDYLKNLWGEWLKHAANIKREMNKMASPETRQLMHRKLKEGERVSDEMPKIVRGLARMKAWAGQNLKGVREKKTAVSFLKDQAELLKSTEDVVRDIDTSFLSLEFEEPPVVEFSVDIEKFRLKNVPEKEE